MSEQPASKKPIKNTFAIAVAVMLIALGGAMYASMKVETPAPAESAAGEQGTSEETAATQEPAAQETAPEAGFDLATVKAERILGNPSAPIKIAEFASLTCSHCATFHKESFAAVKASLIDTGKAYLVFSDFPLNAAALHASMTARCLPQERYFDFISELFATQEEWAFDGNYLSLLKTKAAGFGLSEEQFKACINNKDIQESIVGRMRAAQQTWSVNSTPSFVINNKTLIPGATADVFIKQVEEAAAGQAAPEAAEPSAGAE